LPPLDQEPVTNTAPDAKTNLLNYADGSSSEEDSSTKANEITYYNDLEELD
jgi:hypothetical protein